MQSVEYKYVIWHKWVHVPNTFWLQSIRLAHLGTSAQALSGVNSPFEVRPQVLWITGKEILPFPIYAIAHFTWCIFPPHANLLLPDMTASCMGGATAHLYHPWWNKELGLMWLLSGIVWGYHYKLTNQLTKQVHYIKIYSYKISMTINYSKFFFRNWRLRHTPNFKLCFKLSMHIKPQNIMLDYMSLLRILLKF